MVKKAYNRVKKSERFYYKLFLYRKNKIVLESHLLGIEKKS